MRVLDEEQKIGDGIRAPILDERALQLERVGVSHEAEAADL
jgi:hypothetical protein